MNPVTQALAKLHKELRAEWMRYRDAAEAAYQERDYHEASRQKHFQAVAMQSADIALRHLETAEQAAAQEEESHAD